MQELYPIKQAGYQLAQLADRLLNHVRERHSCFKQSRVVERGFLAERRLGEAQSANSDMAEHGVLAELI